MSFMKTMLKVHIGVAILIGRKDNLDPSSFRPQLITTRLTLTKPQLRKNKKRVLILTLLLQVSSLKRGPNHPSEAMMTQVLSLVNSTQTYPSTTISIRLSRCFLTSYSSLTLKVTNTHKGITKKLRTTQCLIET